MTPESVRALHAAARRRGCRWVLIETESGGEVLPDVSVFSERAGGGGVDRRSGGRRGTDPGRGRGKRADAEPGERSMKGPRYGAFVGLSVDGVDIDRLATCARLPADAEAYLEPSAASFGDLFHVYLVPDEVPGDAPASVRELFEEVRARGCQAVSVPTDAGYARAAVMAVPEVAGLAFDAQVRVGRAMFPDGRLAPRGTKSEGGGA